MKSCRFVELRVLSHIQKAARTIRFDPEANVLLGPNDTGKSSLIKTLFWTVGAEPSRISEKWKALDVKALLRFTVGDDEISVLRDGATFALFDRNDKLLSVYRSITNQLAPRLAKLFDFKLQLADREGEPRTPTPAFLYLPFYIDQDGGWSAPWSSFTGLQQFKDWKKDTIEYHAGIKPNAYYAAKAELHRLTHVAQEPRAKRTALGKLQEDVSERMPPIAFAVDLEVYKTEVNALLERCRALQAAEEAYRDELAALETRRVVLEAQQRVVSGVSLELDGDYAFAASQPDTVTCPTCGEEYENGFAERFAIAQDEDRCIQLATELRNDLDELEEERQAVEARLARSQQESEAAKKLLESKQGEVTLQQLIRNEGRREVATLLDEEGQVLDDQLAKLEVAMGVEREKMEKFSSRERRKEITEAYRELMRASLLRLNVQTLPEKAFANLTSTLRATGSDLPRAVLAYFISVLRLIERYASGTMFPIVIDAVNQQEQDDANLRRMLQFIRDERPVGSQLIVGLVNAKGVKLGGKLEAMDTPFGALRGDAYGEVADYVRPFVAATVK